MSDKDCVGCNEPIPPDKHAKAAVVAPGCQIALPMNCFIPTAVTVANDYTCEAAIIYGWLFPLTTQPSPDFKAQYINPGGSVTFPPPGPQTDANNPIDPNHVVYPATFIVYNKGPGSISVNYYMAAPPCIETPTPPDPFDHGRKAKAESGEGDK